MRISTSQIYSIADIGMRDAQVAINKTHEQLTSGKRVLSSADDPIAATSILTINQELSRTTQFKKNVDTADNNLSLEETTLQSVISLVQRLREISVAAGNTAVLTSSDYKALAAEVDSRMDELMNLQNTRNASSQYIFSGFQSEVRPFENQGGGNFSYEGDEGQLRLQVSTTATISVSDSGKRLFMDIPSSHNTFNTFPNSANKAVPPAVITVGDVIDQVEYDKFFPQDMKVSFNASSTVIPAALNYTITDRATGKVLGAPNQLFVSGQDIQVNGTKFAIFGSPNTGTAAIPATLDFGAVAPNTISLATPSTISITAGGRTEILTLAQPITDNLTLAAALQSVAGAPNSNADKLLNLGLTVTPTGFSSVSGLNVSVKNGDAQTDNALGFATQGAGTSSVNFPFTFGGAFNFSTTPKTVDIVVNGKTETLTLDQNVTDNITLAAAFNSAANAPKLARLGIVATPTGLISNTNAVINVRNGDASIDQVTGAQTQGVGAVSTRGILAIPGDSFIIESTNKQGLLTSVSRFSEAMKKVENTPESKVELAKIIAKTLTNLQNAIDNMATAQGDVGARQNMLESTKDLHLDTELFGKVVLSQLEDLDYAEASTRLQMQTFVLSASQQSFVKISQLSLFTYL